MTARNHYGQPGNSITGQQRAEIVAWIREGLTRNEIAKRAGRSGSTISGIAKAEGLEFGQRSKVAAATEARTVDLKSRRAKILDREYTEWERALEIVESSRSYRAKVKVKGGGETIRTLDFIPADDLRNLANARAAIARITGDLEARDADQGAEGAKSLLADLGRALGVRGPDA